MDFPGSYSFDYSLKTRDISAAETPYHLVQIEQHADTTWKQVPYQCRYTFDSKTFPKKPLKEREIDKLCLQQPQRSGPRAEISRGFQSSSISGSSSFTPVRVPSDFSSTRLSHSTCFELILNHIKISARPLSELKEHFLHWKLPSLGLLVRCAFVLIMAIFRWHFYDHTLFLYADRLEHSLNGEKETIYCSGFKQGEQIACFTKEDLAGLNEKYPFLLEKAHCYQSIQRLEKKVLSLPQFP